MSLLEKFDRKLESVIARAIDHARLTTKLNDDLVAIESKVGARIEAARGALAEDFGTRLEVLKAEFVGATANLRHDGFQEFDGTVGALAPPQATPAASGEGEARPGPAAGPV